MINRCGNNPKRRITALDCLSDEIKTRLKEGVRYVGSGHHKVTPGDYGNSLS